MRQLNIGLGFFGIILLIGRFQDSPDHFLCYISGRNTFHFYIEIARCAFGIKFYWMGEEDNE